jgi:hypothetical protein
VFIGAWICITHPSVTILYTILLIIYNKADIFNLIAAVIPVIISTANFFIAKQLIFSFKNHDPKNPELT